jgi:hypothetical protein
VCTADGPERTWGGKGTLGVFVLNRGESMQLWSLLPHVRVTLKRLGWR